MLKVLLKKSFHLGDKLVEFGLELPFAMRMTKLLQDKWC